MRGDKSFSVGFSARVKSVENTGYPYRVERDLVRRSSFTRTLCTNITGEKRSKRVEWRGGYIDIGSGVLLPAESCFAPIGNKVGGTNEQRQARYRAMTAFKRPFFFFTSRLACLNVYFDFFSPFSNCPSFHQSSKKRTTDPLNHPRLEEKRGRIRERKFRNNKKIVQKSPRSKKRVEMNNATSSKFRAWDHWSLLSIYARNDISMGGGKKEEDDRSLGSAWKRVENCCEESRRRIHSPLMPRNSHILD